VARIIGADAGQVAMHQNVSVCQSVILSCFDTTPETRRNKIVYSELEFPSVMYAYEAHARDGRFRIEKVKSEDGITAPLEPLLAAIDEETLLVPLSHVLFKSAFLQDARAITERAHEVGALVVLDTYQSAGTVPFSVKELDVDFATGGSVKWLCGGPGAGYLYVAPRRRACRGRLASGLERLPPTRSRHQPAHRRVQPEGPLLTLPTPPC
ncbi:MAG: aminotransferase class V, partial [Acidobacteria bacterium]